MEARLCELEKESNENKIVEGQKMPTPSKTVNSLSRNRPTSSDNSKKSVFSVTAEIHHRGISKKLLEQNLVKDSDEIVSLETDDKSDASSKPDPRTDPNESCDNGQDNGPFRHTQADRKKILRGRSTNIKPKQFKLEAVGQSKMNSSLEHLVYVGKLATSATTGTLKDHLIMIGIKSENVKDITQLKCRKENEHSFCISLVNEGSNELIYNTANWPEGVRIRPFKKFALEAASSSSRPMTNTHVQQKDSLKSVTRYLAYVGKLAKQTTLNSLRKHLIALGLFNNSLLDILQLNCRNENEKSFCVSVDNEGSFNTILNPNNWPSGVRVRPYQPRASRQYRGNKSHSASLHVGVKGEQNRWLNGSPNIHSYTHRYGSKQSDCQQESLYYPVNSDLKSSEESDRIYQQDQDYCDYHAMCSG